MPTVKFLVSRVFNSVRYAGVIVKGWGGAAPTTTFMRVKLLGPYFALVEGAPPQKGRWGRSPDRR